MSGSIGIDLGTTNSCISYLEGNEAGIIPNPEGARVIPSLIAMDKNGQRIFGNSAKRQFITNTENTIWGIKRLIGRKFNSDEVKKIYQRVGFQIIEAANGDVKVRFGNRLHSPEEISSMLLRYLKTISENYLNETVSDAVITVPAFFNDAQRQATKIAGEIAGFNVLRIINEPTAALIAYRDKIKKDGLYAVYDLGGGTFDISIIEVKSDIYKVIATSGDTFLGGNDFDERIIEWIIAEVKNDISVDIYNDKISLQRIIENAEKAKIELSFNEETTISIPYLYHHPNQQSYNFQKIFTRKQLEEYTKELIDKTISIISKTLSDANLIPSQIEKVILVGGQSRMPIIAERLNDLFKKEPFIDLNPEEVVAQGAALQAEIIRGKVKDLLLLDVTPLSLGIETKNNTFTTVVEKNSTIPIKKSMIFTTITDNQHTVKIHVLQGERKLASENKSLGYFNLIGISPAPKGLPLIEVTFSINANGIVIVSALDKRTNKSQSMQIQPASGLSKEDVNQLIMEAKMFEEHDKNLLQFSRVKEEIQEEINALSAFINRFANKISTKERLASQNIITKAEAALKQNSQKDIEKLLIAIQNLRHKFNQKLVSLK
jgi:molecular chaperone DnaK